jgi:GTP:adenosylcobinamide-phosphate guanylyltransferase
MFISIVLAGERTEKNELLEYTGFNTKSLIEINEKPMILYVLDTLLDNDFVDDIFIIGPFSIVEKCGRLKKLIESKKITFREQKASPTESILSIFKELKEDSKIIITTSDNVLIKKEWINYFCEHSLKSGKDILMAVNDARLVKETYPETKRTILAFKDISFSLCNLFAIMNKNGREAVFIWKKVESLRKKPLKIARCFMSIWGLILFLAKQLSSKKAFEIMSKKMNANVGVINLPFAEACIDVDKIDDYKLVKSILNINK